MRCGLDLDGVAYPFVDEYRSFAAELGVLDADCPARYPDDRWDFPARWGLDPGLYLDVLAAGVLDGRLFAAADPLPGAVDAAWALVRSGHDLVVVTARCFPGVAAETVETVTGTWLAHARFPPAELHVRADKTAVELDTMLDDSVDNHRVLRAAGVNAFLLDCPWNRDAPDPGRLATVADYPAAVAALADAPGRPAPLPA